MLYFRLRKCKTNILPLEIVSFGKELVFCGFVPLCNYPHSVVSLYCSFFVQNRTDVTLYGQD